jgi:hypothetical protein
MMRTERDQSKRASVLTTLVQAFDVQETTWHVRSMRARHSHHDAVMFDTPVREECAPTFYRFPTAHTGETVT